MFRNPFRHLLLSCQRLRAWLTAENCFLAKLLGAAFAGVCTLAVVTFIFLNIAVRERESAAKRDTALTAIRLLERVESEVANLDSAFRDLRLSRTPADQERFARRRAALTADFARLSELVGAGSMDFQPLKDVKRDLSRWMGSLVLPEPPLETKIVPRDAGTEAESRVALDQVRFGLAQLLRLETGAFEAASERADSQRTIQTSGFVLLCFLGIFFLLGSSRNSLVVFQRHLKTIEAAQAETRAIVETTVDGVLILDASGEIRSLNPAGEKMFGLSSAELVGEPISRIIPQPHFFRDLKKLGAGTLTAAGRRAGGATFPVELSVNNMEHDGRKHMVATIRDITERRRNEETLRHISLGVSSATGEEFVKSLVQQLSRALQSDFAFVVETGCSSGTSILTLSEAGEMHSTGAFDLAHTACSQVLRDGFHACGEGARAEFPNDALLAGLEIESFVAMPLVDHHGRAVGVMGVLGRSATHNVQVIESTLRIFAARAAAELERKRFAEDLAAEKDRLGVTLRSIGDGFITIDRQERVLLMNNLAERLTGWSAEDAAGMPLEQVFRVLNERTRRLCVDEIQEQVATGLAHKLSGPMLIVAPDGSERLIETNAAPIRDASNRYAGAVLVFRDVTERQRADEERRKSEKLESLGVAAGGIAHDFNNLLTAILGNLSLALYNPELDSSVFDRLTAAKKASLRAQELAAQLLTFAKGGAPIKQTASIDQLVRDTVSFSLHGTSVRSEISIPDDLWAAEIDAGQISQVISNLTINAEQAMPAGGTLRVSCANFQLANENARLGLTAGRYVRITVQDEGIGIPEENIKKIFDPYFTTKPKGSGLGLATSYSIIKSHNGVLDVVSSPGAGTTFYLFLAASDAKPAPEVAAPASEIPVMGSARVLVLDDEVEICALVACALEPLGYEVTQAHDALTAIRTYSEALAAGRRFDLVISDLTIPGGMGGQEAIRRLRELDPDVKAIVSSGYAGDPIMSRFREHGFCGMIAKPYEIDALGRVVAQVLSAPPVNVVAHDFLQLKTA